jgi:DNA primase
LEEDILGIISKVVWLRRAGGGPNYRGLCPFHTEKTPSFNVNTETGVYQCFGCGEQGKASDFLEKLSSRGLTKKNS